MKMDYIVMFLVLLAFASRVVVPVPVETKRVIGGVEVDIAEFPFIASIRLNGVHICGGSIVSQDTILTAAHCIEVVGDNDITVHVGSSNINNGQVYEVPMTITHGKFTNDGLINDIAVIKVSRPINFGPKVQPIDLSEKRPPPGSKAVVAGWGRFSATSTKSAELRAVAVPIVDQEICRAEYAIENKVIDSNMICAGDEEGVMSSCPGDSGGPLVDMTTGTLLGIVSFGQGCGEQAPAVYTSVPDMIDWITRMISF